MKTYAAASNSRWRRVLRSMMPATLRNRVILFMVLGALASQVLVLLIWTAQAKDQARAEVSETAQLLAASATQATRFIRALPVSYRPLLIDQLRTTGGSRFLMQLNRSFVDQPSVEDGELPGLMNGLVQRVIGAELARDGLSGVRVQVVPSHSLIVDDSGISATELPGQWLDAAGLPMKEEQPLLVVQVGIEPGNWLLLASALPNPGLFLRAHPYAPDRLLMILAGLVTVLLIVVGVARGITQSLAHLDKAASAFARDLTVEHIPEQGPLEVQRLAHSFNEMQAQVQRSVADREHLFRSVSHDLKTPIMRLGFRAELLDDSALREGFQKDLQELGVMLQGALSTMRGADLPEPTTRVALGELLGELTEAAIGAGAPVSLAVTEVSVPGKALALKRALGNLIDNAMRYGKRVDVSLGITGDCALVTIRDYGPGLPEDQMEKIFEPYLRLEHGKQVNSQGNGLGLWIARNTVRRHGGDIVLSNHPKGGLVAAVTLRMGDLPSQ